MFKSNQRIHNFIVALYTGTVVRINSAHEFPSAKDIIFNRSVMINRELQN